QTQNTYPRNTTRVPTISCGQDEHFHENFRGREETRSEVSLPASPKTYLRSFFCRQYFSSGLISVISMPALTRNLQLSSSRGWSSSASLPTTRQYWQSWFQQKRP